MNFNDPVITRFQADHPFNISDRLRFKMAPFASYFTIAMQRNFMLASVSFLPS